MTQVFPAERWLVIEDNLATRHSLDVKAALLAWPEIQLQFAPKDASWLNLIEPWWKQVKSLALKERRFETVDELQHALALLAPTSASLPLAQVTRVLALINTWWLWLGTAAISSLVGHLARKPLTVLD